jgi:hypothetical protein
MDKQIYGLAKYYECVARDLGQLRGVWKPDLSSLDPSDRYVIESHCSMDKQIYGLAKYYECVGKAACGRSRTLDREPPDHARGARKREGRVLTGRGSLVDVAVGFGKRRVGSFDRPLELGSGILIEPLELRDQMALFKACHIDRLVHHEVPPDGYALVGTDAAPGDWDQKGRLWKALNYSRLVWHNVMSHEFVAQIRVGTTGDIEQVEAPPVPPQLVRAYLPGSLDPAFPRSEEVAVLNQVLRSPGARSSRPSRVGLAMWRFTHAAFLYAANFRLSLLVGAIETIVDTQRHKAKEQFVTRVAGLSRLCLGHGRFGRAWAQRVYKVRNTLAHGRRLIYHRRGYSSSAAFEKAYSTLILEVEEFVRSVLLAAHTRSDIMALLQSPRKVAGRWPV